METKNKLTPVIDLRFFSTINLVTDEMVYAEQSRTEDSFPKCKSRLEAKTEPVLQKKHIAYDNSEVWLNVESVLEVVYPKNQSSNLATDEPVMEFKGNLIFISFLFFIFMILFMFFYMVLNG